MMTSWDAERVAPLQARHSENAVCTPIFFEGNRASTKSLANDLSVVTWTEANMSEKTQAVV